MVRLQVPAGEAVSIAYENRRSVACVMYNCSFWVCEGFV